MKKRCSKCRKFKKYEEYRPDKRFSTGRRPDCRVCEHPKRIKHSATYRQTPEGRNKRNLAHARMRARYRLVALSAYSRGGPIRCACCGDGHLEFMTLDHVGGGGRKHRKGINKQGAAFYKWLINQGFPPGYQVLCFNCNFAKWRCGECPHQKECI